MELEFVPSNLLLPKIGDSIKYYWWSRYYKIRILRDCSSSCKDCKIRQLAVISLPFGNTRRTCVPDIVEAMRGKRHGLSFKFANGIEVKYED